MSGQLEVFVAFATVMLGVSLLITVGTQMVGVLLNLRGRNLHAGLVLLLNECAPEVAKDAPALVERILLHPLISDSKLQSGPRVWRLATAIRKDELIRLLKSDHFTKELVQAVLERHLSRETSGALWDAAAAELKKADLPALWQTAAAEPAGQRGPKLASELFKAAPAVLTAKLAELGSALERLFELHDRLDQVTAWFDSAMDRTAQRFGQSSHLVTVIASLVLCFAIHLDAFKLLTKLSTDDRLRTALVAASDKLEKEYDTVSASAAGGSAGTKDPGQEAAAGDAGVKKLQSGIDEIKGLNAELAQAEFQLIPTPWPCWCSYCDPMHLWGMVTAAALLSLGAPFWFQSLRTASALRPVVARKEEKERSEKT